MTNRFFLEIIDCLRRCGPFHNLNRRCSKGSYLTYKPVCLEKSKNMMDFSAIPDKLSFLGINQLNTRKIHPPA